MDVQFELIRLERRKVLCRMTSDDGTIAVETEGQTSRLAYRKALAAMRAAIVGGPPLRLHVGEKVHEPSPDPWDDPELTEGFQEGFYDHLRECREKNP